MGKHCAKRFLSFSLFCGALAASLALSFAEEPKTSKTDRGLGSYLRRNPPADADGNGILTLAERNHHAATNVLAKLPEGTTHQHAMVPTRDGVKLATEILLPAGTGPWPIVLCRTGYNRWSAATRDSAAYIKKGVGFASQELRGDEDSEGQTTFSFMNEVDDGYDAIEWLAAQPWCNGRVGVAGSSGHGFAASMAMLSNAPHLVGVSTVNSGGDNYLYWSFHNGVRRQLYNWLHHYGIDIQHAPMPTIRLFDLHKYHAFVRERAAKSKAVFISSSGWYDIFSEAPVDYFAAFAHRGKAFVRMKASGHGRMQGLKYPRANAPPGIKMPQLMDVLKDPNAPLPKRSQILYYVLGDPTDKQAPGNAYKVSDVWPVPNHPTRFYMTGDGRLQRAAPAEKAVSLTYQYDPTDPVPTHGGNMIGQPGPVDQRPLAGRKDVLRFVTTPLAEPLEITGKIWAELYISSDVPDTTFMVKLVDIYPDGYEALVRDSAMMARFRQGLDRPAPLDKGKIYKLRIDMWSTAIVFNKGHCIALDVSSSSKPKYEVHPNTYEPVMSCENAPVANNTVHLSGDHASRLILPVVTH